MCFYNVLNRIVLIILGFSRTNASKIIARLTLNQQRVKILIHFTCYFWYLDVTNFILFLFCVDIDLTLFFLYLAHPHAHNKRKQFFMEIVCLYRIHSSLNIALFLLDFIHDLGTLCIIRLIFL
jgi:hypothetical protein